MRTFKRNPWLPCLVFLLSAAGSVTLARPAPQPQTQTQSTQQSQADEARKKEFERLVQEMQKNAQQPQNPAQPQQPVSPIPSAALRAPSSADLMRLNYDNTPLYDFINQIAEALGITPILIDPDVKGTVNFHSYADLPRQEVFSIFNLILKSNNTALVKVAGIYKIVPTSQGLKEGLEVVQELPPAPPPKPAPDKEVQKKTETAPAEPGKPPSPPAAGQQKTPDGKTTTEAVAGVTTAQLPPGGAAAQKPPVAGAPPTQTPPQQPATPPGQARPVTPEPPHLATHVIRVEFVPVSTLVEPLKLFMSDGGVIMPYERQNMLIITDYSDSVQKLLEIVHMLDNSYVDADLIDMVEIKYNKASDVLDDLLKVFGSGKDGASGIYMVALDRMNSILIMANSNRALGEVKRWIARLDTTTGRNIQNFIYPVQNGTASNIAQVLALLFGGGDNTGASGTTSQQTTGAGGPYVGGTGTGRTATGQTGGVGGSPYSATQQGFNRGMGTTMSSAGQYGGGFGMGSQNPYGFGAGIGALGGMGSTIGGPRLNQNTGGMSAQVLNVSAFSGLQGPVRIVADDINNSLIIQGSEADYNYLLETIKRMDVLPRQAIIDARIFEIDLTDALSFGVSATLQGVQSGDHLTTGKIDVTGALSASTFAFIGNSREILANLNALRTKTKIRILEAPSVLAIDGQMASIQVGGQVPVPSFSYLNTATTGGITSGINYADTGTMLQIQPSISASGMVTLQISQSVTTPGPDSNVGGTTAPTFNTTNVFTTLAVRDGESVAIAGLIRESQKDQRAGVPFLSNLPLLGVLFGQTTHAAARTELLIMITPHVIKTPDKFREMTEQLKDSLRNVGKYAADKENEIKQDQQKALGERQKQEQKQIKKSDQKSDQVPPEKKKHDEPIAELRAAWSPTIRA